MKKNLNTFTIQGLSEVLGNNDKLYFELQDYCLESANFWVSEYLHNAPKCIDYSIGLYNHNYVEYAGYNTPYDYYDILRWFTKLQKDYCYLYGDEKEFEKVSDSMDRYISVIEKEHNGYITVKEKDLDNLWAKLEELVNNELDKICEQLVSEYEYFDNVENVAEYVLEMELLDQYYMISDGSIFRIQEDKLIA